jgi:hypothetical protein
MFFLFFFGGAWGWTYGLAQLYLNFLKYVSCICLLSDSNVSQSSHEQDTFIFTQGLQKCRLLQYQLEV